MIKGKRISPTTVESEKLGGIAQLICMSKVLNFSEIEPNIAFPEFNFYELYYSTFEKSELGMIKKLLPSPRDGRELLSG